MPTLDDSMMMTDRDDEMAAGDVDGDTEVYDSDQLHGFSDDLRKSPSRSARQDMMKR